MEELPLIPTISPGLAVCLAFPSNASRLFRGMGSLGRRSHGIQVFLPFMGKIILLLAITVLAARHNVGLLRGASSGQRNDMIHGQIRRFERLMTIVAFTAGFFFLPPGTIPELARLLFLAIDPSWIRRKEGIKFFRFGPHHAFDDTSVPYLRRTESPESYHRQSQEDSAPFWQS